MTKKKRKAKKPASKIRLNLAISAEAKARLDRMTNPDSTMTDTIRRALVLYERYVDTAATGGSILIEGADGVTSRVVIL